MVKTTTNHRDTIVVLSPNFSMSWKVNLLLIAGISLWSMLIGVGFWFVGAWPIMPFVGLEIVCLTFGLWYTQRKLSRKEVLFISDSEVVFEQGALFPVHRTVWQRQSLRGFVMRRGHHYQAPEIELFDNSGKNLRIGSFLNKADIDFLIVLLKGEGIALITDNQLSRVGF